MKLRKGKRIFKLDNWKNSIFGANLFHFESSWLAENRLLFDPLQAEPRSARIKLLVLSVSDEFEYMQKSGSRLFWDMQVGKEVPIWGMETGDGSTGDYSCGQAAWGIWIPVSFHYTLDHKDWSQPAINTDYRFSIMLKYRLGLNVKAKNYGAEKYFSLRMEPWGHESPHLGDEFTIAARTNNPDFKRINVAWEFWSVSAGLDYIDPDGILTRYLIGLTGLWKNALNAGGRDGSFYWTDPNETQFIDVTTSNSGIEAVYFGFESVDMRDDEREYWPFFSADIRYRILYNYEKSSDEEKDDFRVGINLIWGLRARPVSHTYKGRIEPYFRIYYGVNPNGQFRNQADYWLVGAGLTVDL